MNQDEMLCEELLRRLFPICRSLTGKGVEETLAIIGEHIPLSEVKIASGKRCFDWEVPKEWNVEEAHLTHESGKRVIDFADCNLHLVGYSIPFEGVVTKDELEEHLHSIPEREELIPYVTSYYEPRWGFCLSHRKRMELPDGSYTVVIRTSLREGVMRIGELFLPGTTEEELFFSTNICHPSLGNNELSGLVTATLVAKQLMERSSPRRLSYRFLFLPETIGSIAYLTIHLERLQSQVIAGYVMSCLGDGGAFSYLPTRTGDTLSDRLALHLLKRRNLPYRLHSFLERGSDERQYNWPGIDLPIGSLMRTKYGCYPEYHTSGDNLSFISAKNIVESADLYLQLIEMAELQGVYQTTLLCEPNLGKRGLYSTLSKQGSATTGRKYLDLLTLCDGSSDLLSISERLNCSLIDLQPLVEELLRCNLLIRIG